MTTNTKSNSLVFLTLVNTKTRYFTQNILFFLLILFIFLPHEKITAQNTLNKIVIDAGHGGKDPGASGKYSREKDVVLSIALKTGQLIKQKHPEVEIIYTRKTDVFIPLKERAEIANKSNADLFISIHCNSNKSSQPHGSETYVMGLHKSEANLNVAKAENAAILFEDDYETNYDGFDPTSEESHIIFNFFQNSFSSHNLDLATKMQYQFTNKTPLKDRGVKQAGFWVLYKTTMPGVLLELGFLSNTNDEKFLNSTNGQKKLSDAIAVAVSDYKKSHDAIEKDKAKHKNHDITSSPSDDEKKNEMTTIKPEENVIVPTLIEEEKTKTEAKPIEEEKPVIASEKVIYKVQFLSLSTQKKLEGGKYSSLPTISSYPHKGMYRYTSGESDNYEEALVLQAKVRKAGFNDAFLVAFLNGVRISIKEARAKNRE
ncbi:MULTISPECIES: N-acetylmuramoyl-L-alanine amidase [unclassified Lentimicrobium]|uniref:N-acetylmuramoyl-L-alanine amidase n=1 Tax=unclassified Lentimicrobium TaxID=2677434 RepID=UPI0015517833|nr:MULTISPECIES: N-acetylmuramoyl-L-alanine amidase [unclassified Lentimicrobium]NPD44436.1 N-acetylmuramoyl-L-alanine amidase [Lentimicrobium sp. S6]NPD84298.1 N-acetylmuramoyl-L-alanine amidase [Lentimicrobium sp. L6]